MSFQRLMIDDSPPFEPLPGALEQHAILINLLALEWRQAEQNL